jgi:hypothetical protein
MAISIIVKPEAAVVLYGDAVERVLTRGRSVLTGGGEERVEFI